jgi:hypothetical protein
MRLVWLPAATCDLLWLRQYCERVFPEGAAAARARIRAMERLLLHAGRPCHRAGVRRLLIRRTPFFVVYRPTAAFVPDPTPAARGETARNRGGWRLRGKPLERLRFRRLESGWKQAGIRLAILR